jgi:hypothetical protein
MLHYSLLDFAAAPLRGVVTDVTAGESTTSNAVQRFAIQQRAHRLGLFRMYCFFVFGCFFLLLFCLLLARSAMPCDVKPFRVAPERVHESHFRSLLSQYITATM